MARLFSKRNAPPPEELCYDLPEEVRARVLAVLEDRVMSEVGDRLGFDRLLEDVGRILFKEYGGLCQSSYRAARRSNHPVIEHFYCCETGQALDFIEACLQQSVYTGGQRGVDEINEIFCEEGIAYELTPYVGKSQYPTVIRRDHQLAHQEITEPGLLVFADKRLRVANQEMLGAHSALRAGDSEKAITLSGSAFESLLKTVCSIKRWEFDPDRDTCAKLVTICRKNGLFPPFYTSVFEAVGT